MCTVVIGTYLYVRADDGRFISIQNNPKTYFPCRLTAARPTEVDQSSGEPFVRYFTQAIRVHENAGIILYFKAMLLRNRWGICAGVRTPSPRRLPSSSVRRSQATRSRTHALGKNE